MSRNITIEMGAIAKPLRDQLNMQGIVIEDKVGERLEKALDAVARLKINGYITARESEKARDRIWKDISKVIKQAEGEA